MFTFMILPTNSIRPIRLEVIYEDLKSEKVKYLCMDFKRRIKTNSVGL